MEGQVRNASWGVRITRLPITQAKILQALTEKRKLQAADEMAEEAEGG